MHSPLFNPVGIQGPQQPVTVVLGASPKPWRYAYQAVERLRQKGHTVVAIGRRPGAIGEVPIVTNAPDGLKVDTVTLYLNADNQAPWQDAILAWRPRRIIFNPGAENEQLAARAALQGIEVVEGCTLVMLSVGRY